MVRCLAILLVLGTSMIGQNYRGCAQPAWTVNLATYSFRPFGIENLGDAPYPQGWAESRGVTFLSPHLVAIYQVAETGLPSVADVV
jgi:hypothetical protein